MTIDAGMSGQVRRDNLLVVTVFIAALALVAATVGVGFGLRAIDESKSGSGTVGAAAEPVMVSMSEFKIASATVGTSGSLHVMNEGSAEHNVTIEDTSLATANLGSGASETLDVSSLSPGAYSMFCSIAGHREAGMEAALTVTEGGASAASSGRQGDMDFEVMTKAMLARMGAFPQKTAGLGNQRLEPTKVVGNKKYFDVTAEITKWEVEKGKVVDAWTYNGTVPAPAIYLNVGDEAELTLHNKLPVASDIHLHGINVKNKFDGVAPLTQPLVQPGEEFTYEFTADEVAVAMYHPHFMSQVAMPNGMFGAIFVGDYALPDGVEVAQRIPMVLNDSGVIGLSLNGKSFPATAPIVANTGDWVLIDYFNEGSQYHPMHLHQFDQIVIAQDGFPVPQPYTVDTLNVGPGNRFTVLAKLDEPGTWAWHCHILPHVENDNGMFGMVTAVVVK